MMNKYRPKRPPVIINTTFSTATVVAVREGTDMIKAIVQPDTKRRNVKNIRPKSDFFCIPSKRPLIINTIHDTVAMTMDMPRGEASPTSATIPSGRHLKIEHKNNKYYHIKIV